MVVLLLVLVVALILLVALRSTVVLQLVVTGLTVLLGGLAAWSQEGGEMLLVV